LYQRDLPTAATAFGTVVPTGPSYCCYCFWHSCTNGTFLLLLLLLAQLYQRDVPTAATTFDTVVPTGPFYCCYCFGTVVPMGTFRLLLSLSRLPLSEFAGHSDGKQHRWIDTIPPTTPLPHWTEFVSEIKTCLKTWERNRPLYNKKIIIEFVRTLYHFVCESSDSSPYFPLSVL